MARKPRPTRPLLASLSPIQMREAIPILERRINDVKKFDVTTITMRSSPQAVSLQQKIDTTLDEVFGPDTIERRRFHINLDTAPRIMSSMGRGGTSISEVISGYERGCVGAIAKLQTAIELFKEKIGDIDDGGVSSTIRAIETLDLHPAIASAATQRYRDGHFADAIETSCKVLVNLVQGASEDFDRDGVPLMQAVFSAKSPILRFNELTDQTDESEQRGYMDLYSGAIGAFRNPRAHKVITDDPEFALEAIAIISFLAKMLDQSEK